MQSGDQIERNREELSVANLAEPLLELAFRRAVATSLVIVTLTALAALVSHLIAGARPDLTVTATLAGATMPGALAGARVCRRLPQAWLGHGFALVVDAVAAFLLVDTALLGGPPGH